MCRILFDCLHITWHFHGIKNILARNQKVNDLNCNIKTLKIRYHLSGEMAISLLFLTKKLTTGRLLHKHWQNFDGYVSVWDSTDKAPAQSKLRYIFKNETKMRQHTHPLSSGLVRGIIKKSKLAHCAKTLFTQAGLKASDRGAKKWRRKIRKMRKVGSRACFVMESWS